MATTHWLGDNKLPAHPGTYFVLSRNHRRERKELDSFLPKGSDHIAHGGGTFGSGNWCPLLRVFGETWGLHKFGLWVCQAVKQHAWNTHGDMPPDKSGAGGAIDAWPARKKQVHNNFQLLPRVLEKNSDIDGWIKSILNHAKAAVCCTCGFQNPMEQSSWWLFRCLDAHEFHYATMFDLMVTALCLMWLRALQRFGTRHKKTYNRMYAST